jgi:hypothetical protein
VQLPNGERGILTGLDYSDDHTALTWSRRAGVQPHDLTAPGAVTPSWRGRVLETTSGQVITLTGFGAVPLTLSVED